jgi:hypothetical protein
LGQEKKKEKAEVDLKKERAERLKEKRFLF